MDLGADDYLAKPFDMMELISRVKAVMRRCNAKAGENHLIADLPQRNVLADGERVPLTYKEFELLAISGR